MRSCQLGAASVGMSARRGTASVSMNPPLLALRGMASFLNQLAKRAPFGWGSFCVQKLSPRFLLFSSLPHPHKLSRRKFAFPPEPFLWLIDRCRENPCFCWGSVKQSLIENPCIHKSLYYNRNIPRVLDCAERCGRVEIIGSRDNSEVRGAISLAIVTWELQNRRGVNKDLERGSIMEAGKRPL